METKEKFLVCFILFHGNSTYVMTLEENKSSDIFLYIFTMLHLNEY